MTEPQAANPNPGSVADVASEIVTDVEQGKEAYAEAAPAVSEVKQITAPVLGGEPAVILGTLTGVVIAVLSVFNVLPVETSVGVVTSIAPVIGGFITRFFVSPAHKVVGVVVKK